MIIEYDDSPSIALRVLQDHAAKLKEFYDRPGGNRRERQNAMVEYDKLQVRINILKRMVRDGVRSE